MNSFLIPTNTEVFAGDNGMYNNSVLQKLKFLSQNDWFSIPCNQIDTFSACVSVIHKNTRT